MLACSLQDLLTWGKGEGQQLGSFYQIPWDQNMDNPKKEISATELQAKCCPHDVSEGQRYSLLCKDSGL